MGDKPALARLTWHYLTSPVINQPVPCGKFQLGIFHNFPSLDLCVCVCVFVLKRNDQFPLGVRISSPAERSLFKLCKLEACFDADDKSAGRPVSCEEERFIRGGYLDTTSSGGGFSPENKNCSVVVADWSTGSGSWW